jgi:hypothetical protein
MFTFLGVVLLFVFLQTFFDEIQRQLTADRRIASTLNGHVALFTTRDVMKST